MKKESNLAYVGSVSTIETNKPFAQLEHMKQTKTAVSFNERQAYLYSRLLTGLRMFTKEELYKMNSTKKNRIKRNNLRAQKELNLWKQELTIAQSNSFRYEFFSEDSEFMQQMNTLTDTSKNFLSTISFKDLGLTKKDIANMFISKGLLPNNFWEL